VPPTEVSERDAKRAMLDRGSYAGVDLNQSAGGAKGG
jgi:hypothetical protein